MPRWSRAGAFAPALLAAVVAVACSGDDVLGPPDGPSCTVGSVAPGDSVHAVLSSANCQAFDNDSYVITFAASWTLSMKKGQAYVVRMYHDSTPAGDLLNASLQAYGRGPSGEPGMVTDHWGSFGTANGNGGNNEELFLVAERDRSISIRISAETPADTGAYSLVVATCPVTAMNDTTTLTGVDISTGCRSRTADPTLGGRVAFVTFPTDSDSVHVTLHRTAGTGTFYSWVSSPMPDIDCWGNDCDGSEAGFDTVAIHKFKSNLPSLAGIFLAVRGDSSATISVSPQFTAPATVAGRAH